MKSNKVTKLGISLLSVAALGVVAPALTDVPVFGVSIVKAEETRPLKYTIAYYDKDTGEEIAPRKTGTINPGETVNIYKDIDGYQVVSNFDEWMPGFNATYRIVSENFGFSDGRLFMDLSYKKVNADAKPSEKVKPETKPSETPKPEVKPAPKPSDTPKPEVKPETKPSDTPKPEVKPETKPSETPKPEVKPEPAPKADENQKSIKYLIDYLDADTGEEITHEIGVLNPGETINIHKNIDGYEVVTNRSWMPDFNVDYRTMNRHFGFADGRQYTFLRYKKVNADAKPSETPKPEVKPAPKPSETPKPEVKPEPKPSETPKPEVKPAPKPSDTSKPEVKPETKPSDTSKPEVKPAPKPSETPKPEVKPEPKPSDTSKPEVKPAPKPSETPKPEVKPAPKPSDTSKPEVKPAPKPSDTSKPEVKPAPKPSDTPKPEVKPVPKPSETPKPEVKPEPKPSDTSKPEVKPELKPQTNSNTAPTAPVKPVGQTSNSKADKPTAKKETPALPNTGEQSSSLSLVGLLLASLGLAGLTYKGRH